MVYLGIELKAVYSGCDKLEFVSYLMRNPRGDCGFLAGIREFLESWNDGQRQPSNLAYSLKGLKVVNSATVHKVVFAEDDAGVPKASAAVLKDGRQFKAREEVVLSAGAIKTPQILMLSGIMELVPRRCCKT